MSRDEINRQLGQLLPTLQGMAAKLCRKYRLSVSQYADELVSAATLRIAQGLAKYDPAKMPFGIWVRWVSRKAMYQWFKHSGQKHRTLPLDRDVADESTVEREAEAKERAAVVQKALMRLPEPQRCVIGGEFFVGQTHRVMRGSLGLSEFTFRNTRTSGLNRLRTALEGVA